MLLIVHCLSIKSRSCLRHTDFGMGRADCAASKRTRGWCCMKKVSEKNNKDRQCNYIRTQTHKHTQQKNTSVHTKKHTQTRRYGHRHVSWQDEMTLLLYQDSTESSHPPLPANRRDQLLPRAAAKLPNTARETGPKTSTSVSSISNEWTVRSSQGCLHDCLQTREGQEKRYLAPSPPPVEHLPMCSFVSESCREEDKFSTCISERVVHILVASFPCD